MASGPTAQLKTTGVTRARGESDQSYNARVSAYNKAQAKAAADAKTASDASAAASKQKLDSLIASKYPQGLPSWVAANGLKPTLSAQPNTIVFLKTTPDGRTYYGEQGEFKTYYSNSSQGLDPLAFLGGLALSFFLPGVGAAITESLVASGIMSAGVAANAAGIAIANTAANMAQGQTFEDALKNSVINTAVSTGSIPFAKEVNSLINHPAVTDALVSAASSAVKTAAAGGTEQDIINNMTGALAGSAASSAYQLGGADYTRQTGRVIGSAVAGYVTSGPTGAITSAVGELGSQSKGKVAGTIEDVVSPQDKGALPASQVAAMTPETDAGAVLPTVEVTAQRPADITGTNIISPAAVTTAPVTAPAAAALEPVTVAGQRTGDITDTDVINAIAAETTPAAVVTPAAEVAAPVTTPAAELPPVTVTGQRTGDITDTDIINTIAAETTPDAVLPPVTVTATRPADITKTDIIEEPARLQDVTVTGTREEPDALAPVTITGKRDGELDPVTVTSRADEPTATPEEEPVPKDKPYKPDLFILGGKQPKAPTKPSTSVLGQALGTTTGLTASRGAGEIEDTSTGKKRKKVWNEETLRLKDALGV